MTEYEKEIVWARVEAVKLAQVHHQNLGWNANEKDVLDTAEMIFQFLMKCDGR